MKLFRRKNRPTKTNRNTTRRKVALMGALTAVLIFLIMGIASATGSGGLLNSSAEDLEDGAKVQEDSELKYFLNVKYDGVDKNGTQSSDTTMSTVFSGQVLVEDKLPAGLIFQSFVETDDGSIGAVSRDGNSTPCAGRVIDDTGDTTGWINGDTEYVYHGLHYNTATRTVSFKVEKLRAGCQVSVGIITKTPTLPTGVNRMDFFNTASVLEGTLSNKSNTVHTFIGAEDATLHKVTYRYTGTIPDNAPAVPGENQYTTGSDVGVEAEPTMNGYTFSGWTPVTSGVTVAQGAFTMPDQDVVFEGSWTKKAEYKVTYEIDGDAPEGYLVPKEKSYGAGDQVSLDSLKPGDVINGYRFLGWENTELGINPSDYDPDNTDNAYPTGFDMPEKNIVIKGKFEQIKYDVSYEFEGTIIPPNSSALLPATASYAPGVTVTTATTPITAGTYVNSSGQIVDEPANDGQTYYKFLGWYKSASFLMPEEDVVIKGEWMQLSGTFAPVIEKTELNESAHPDGYKKGETVEFCISVENTANFAINTVAVAEEDLDGAIFVSDEDNDCGSNNYDIRTSTLAQIPTIAAGAKEYIKAQFTITDDAPDMLTNKVEILGALADNGYMLDTEQDYTDTEDFKIQKGTFTPEITKTVNGSTSGYKIGDTVKFTIIVTNPEDFNLTNIVVSERMAGAKFTAGSGYTVNSDTQATIASLDAGDSITLNAEYTVTANTANTYTNTVQITSATAENRYTLDCSADGACEDDTSFTTERATFTPEITKTIPNEKTGYKKGETVNFTIAVKNTASFAIKDVKVEEKLDGAKFTSGTGYTLSSSDKVATIATIAAGATVNLSAQYTVTDDSKDSFTNVVEITDAKSDNGYELSCPTNGCKDDEDFNITGDFAPEITKSVVGSTSGYKIGDTVNFQIKVKNPEDFDLKNVIVEEQLSGAEFVYGNNDNYDRVDATHAKIAVLAAGTEVTLNAKYVVSANTVTTYENVTEITSVEPARDGWTLEDGDYTAKAQFSTTKGEFTPQISKSIPNEKAKGYKKGETVNFEIKVKNTESFDLKNVIVEEQLSGAEFVYGNNDNYDRIDATHAKIAVLAAGTEVTLNAKYVVSDDSVASFTNTVKITSATADNGYELNCTGACTADEDFKITGDFTLEVTKSIPNEKPAYKKGEKVSFEIKVKNTESFAIKNVKVEEQLSGAKFVAGSGYTVDSDSKATITAIAAGATATLNAEYTVTDDLPDSYTNVVEVTDATGENDWELDKTKTYKDDEEFLIEKGTFTPQITKAVDGSTSGYKIGDTVSFTITVTNPESFKLTNVKLSEQLSGVKFVAGSGYTVDSDTQVTIAEIAAGASATVKAEYTVSANTASTYTNKVKIISATAENRYTLDCTDACEADADFNTEKGTFTPQITKTIPNEKTAYKKGEKVSFEIKVTNTADFTIKNVVLNEQLSGVKFVAGSGYTVDSDTKATIATIAAGATATVNAEYTVTENTQTTLKNVVTLTSASSDKGYELSCPATGCQADEDFDVTEPDFAPEITKSVQDAKDYYNKGDKVTFTVSVKNTADFTIKDVVVVEQLAGTVFIDGEGYTVDAEDATKATIAEIAAGATVALTSEYTVAEDATLTIENIAQITSATGENGEKLRDGDYIAKAKFNTVKTPSPVVPSNPDPVKPTASPFTGDNIVSIAVLAFASLTLITSAMVLSIRKRV